jgi:tetratricopeptide (TPR) repeat protein
MQAFTPLAATALLGLGELAIDVYDGKEAKGRFEEALTLSQEHSSQANMGLALASLGYLALYQGEFRAAADFLRQSVALTRETAFQLAVAFELAELGTALWSLGDLTAAEKAIEEALAIPAGASFKEELAVLTLYRAQLPSYVGRYETARELTEGTLALVRKTKPERIIGPRIWCPAYIPKSYSGRGAVGRAYGVLGRAALGEERYAEAGQALTESVAAFQAIGARDHEAWALAGLARAAYGLSNRVEAEQHLLDALKIVVEIRAFIPLLHLMPIITLILAEEENVAAKERAVELHAMSLKQPFLAQAQLFEDIAWRQARAATAVLPSELVEAAQARGLALDWWETAEALLVELGEWR